MNKIIEFDEKDFCKLEEKMRKNGFEDMNEFLLVATGVTSYLEDEVMISYERNKNEHGFCIYCHRWKDDCYSFTPMDEKVFKFYRYHLAPLVYALKKEWDICNDCWNERFPIPPGKKGLTNIKLGAYNMK